MFNALLRLGRKFRDTREPWEIALEKAAKCAKKAAKRGVVYTEESGNGYTLRRYENPDGELDYRTYRSIQEIGNRNKLAYVFTDDQVVGAVSAHARRSLGCVTRVLCHGTRNGAEQGWFKSQFPNANILGTEIASTATQYPMTIQWDFHDTKPEWLGYWDVIYSNSWDHTYDPKKMFAAWAQSLQPNGYLYLEHDEETHGPEDVCCIDGFGATPEALRAFVTATGLQHHDTIQVNCWGTFPRQILAFSRSPLHPADDQHS